MATYFVLWSFSVRSTLDSIDWSGRCTAEKNVVRPWEMPGNISGQEPTFTMP